MKRFKHGLSHYKLLSADMGKLYPVSCMEVLPGDTFQHRTSALIRVSPLVAPVMHPCSVHFQSYYVPNRVVFPEWEPFITGGSDGNDETQLPVVQHGANPSVDTPLLDYLGVAPVPGIDVTALPVMAFNKIYNEYFRDQDLIAPRDQYDMTIPHVAWEKDYFTASRPFLQKGESVTLPVGGQAPVQLVPGTSDPALLINAATGLPEGSSQNIYSQAGTGAFADQNDVITMRVDPNGTLEADLGSAEQISVNDFRMGFALQRYKEARARYGSRFTEYLRYLGVKSSDSRLQRPEFLSGGRQTLNFSEILQTASDDIGQEQTPVGTLRGHGIAGMRTKRYRRFFEEHGYVITLMYVRPKTIYNNSIHRGFLRKTKEDYWQRELQFVGQQELYLNEVYADAANGSDVFSFTDRYADYRSHPSGVAGEFRNDLNYWHMARDFAQAPVLNADFVNCDATQRIHADQTETQKLWCMVNHSVQARRLVAKPSINRVI